PVPQYAATAPQPPPARAAASTTPARPGSGTGSPGGPPAARSHTQSASALGKTPPPQSGSGPRAPLIAAGVPRQDPPIPKLFPVPRLIRHAQIETPGVAKWTPLRPELPPAGTASCPSTAFLVSSAGVRRRPGRAGAPVRGPPRLAARV